MKWIAICLNLLLIAIGLYQFAANGAPSKDEIFLVIVVFAAPVSSVLAIFLAGADSWVVLYFKRKALEERLRIGQLNKSE